MRAKLWLIVIALLGCSSDPEGGADPTVTATSDHDGDGIPDLVEGRAENVDTDGDGFPDYRDFDSDGDGILDKIEAGDAPTAPRDTDGDGAPDYRDKDSDGDGIDDTRELNAKFEIVDTDGDGIPDHLDRDSDGDGIPDLEEGAIDSDGDGIPNFRDLDSDGDGIPDACEAGDTPTSPRHSDMDGRPDYLDADADGDGIADAEEDKNGNCIVDKGESSPSKVDTDGDGVPDLVEKLAGADPGDPTSKIPATDFYFVLPYLGARGSGPIPFSTTVRQADVFFSIDNTGSMEGETDNLKANVVASVIPGIGAVIPSAAFGVGRFRDFPIATFGLTSDRPYELRQAVTTDVTKMGAAFTALPAPGGGLDVPESGYEALFQWASGAGVPSFSMPAFRPNPPDGVGGGGFRKDSLPIIVHITDATAHAPADYGAAGKGLHGRDEAVAALNAIGARVIGINSLENAGTSFEPRTQLEDLAVATKAVIPPDMGGRCPTGTSGTTYPPKTVAGKAVCPVVFDVRTDGTGLSTLIVDAIKQLAALAELDVSTRPIGKTAGEAGEVIPPGTTTADFIESIKPVAPPPAGATIDGDIFRTVKPGSTVTFHLEAYNDFVPATEKDQLFTINIQVLGDGVTVLDTRKVFVIVPKQIKEVVIK